MLEEILHKLIIAMIAGFTEFFCVSGAPHRLLYENMTGFVPDDPMLNLFLHIGCLVALILSCKKRLGYLLRADRQDRYTRRRRNRHLDMNAVREAKMVKVAMVPLLLSFLFYLQTSAWLTGPAMLALFLTLNGFLLFLPGILPQGNKDSSMMSPLDSILMGLGGALSVIPGVSRIAGLVTGGMVRGVSQHNALEYALLVSVPALAVVICFDVYAVAVAGLTVTALGFLIWVLAAAASCGSAYLGIMLMRYIAVKGGFHSFCYYSWGMAMFSFVLYLIV